MARSKTISLYLMDGELSERVRCTMGGWLGVVYKSPRTFLDKFTDKDIANLQQAGVYLLFGKDKKNIPTVYVGQAGVRKNGKGVLGRVQEPHPTIDWTEAVMLTTKDNSFGLDDISYLENHFCKMALDAGQYRVKNGNDPNPGFITEERENELEDSIDNVKMIMAMLGYKVFEKDDLQIQNGNIDTDGTVLHMKYKEGEALGQCINDGFVIFKGSKINPTTTKSCPENVLRAREKYADKINENYELTSDIPMTSASAAAGFVAGAQLNGYARWHDVEGRTLKQIEEQFTADE